MGKIAIIIFRRQNSNNDGNYTDLIIPSGYEKEIIEVSDESDNIAAAFNKGMESSDADYKVYLIDDIEIIKPSILVECIRILENESIGMIGVDGNNAIMPDGSVKDFPSASDGFRKDILAIKRGFSVCKSDVRWRDDLYEGNAELCYISQCIEFRKRGLHVSTLDKNSEWISCRNSERNDIGIEKFMNEYSKDLFPTVAILIPTHERPQLFESALNSALNQTYKNIVVIVSDNSMGEETAEVVRRYQTDDSRIIYSHVPGISATANWTNCWKKMPNEAEYVNYLMDDDLFDPNKISVMMGYFITNSRLSLATSYRTLIDEFGNELPDREWNKRLIQETSYVNGKGASKQLIKKAANWIGEPTTVLFKRAFIKDYLWGWTGKEKYSLGDAMLWLRLLEYGDLVYICEPLSKYRQHTGMDSYNKDTSMRCILAFASMIQTIWNDKRDEYSFTENDLREALQNWLHIAVNMVREGYSDGLNNVLFSDFLIVFKECARVFSEENPEKIHFQIEGFCEDGYEEINKLVEEEKRPSEDHGEHYHAVEFCLLLEEMGNYLKDGKMSINQIPLSNITDTVYGIMVGDESKNETISIIKKMSDGINNGDISSQVCAEYIQRIVADIRRMGKGEHNE